MAYLSGWTKRVPLTIDHSLVGAGGVANFPMLAPMTLPDEVVAGLANPDGRCIRFCNDAADTLYPHELVSINGAAWQAWVQMPSVLSSSDTTVYMNYGNAAAEMPSLAEQRAVWSGYAAVWHCNESSGTLRDATGHGFDLTPHGTPTYGADGPIGAGIGLPGLTSTYFDNASAAAVATPMAFSCWSKPSAGTSSVMMISTSGTWKGRQQMMWRDYAMLTAEHVSDAGSASQAHSAAAIGSWDQWYHIATTFDTAARQGYINASPGVKQTTSIVATGVNRTYVGIDQQGGLYFPYKGALSEMRVATSELSGGWLATEYNNQSDPAAFSAWGPVESLASYVPHRRTILYRSGPTLRGVIS